jgi:transcriptional regulator with GAF, ATPase, and Fis domain
MQRACRVPKASDHAIRAGCVLQAVKPPGSTVSYAGVAAARHGRGTAFANILPVNSPAIDLILGVWREACRHSEIGDSLAAIAPLLARSLPLDLLLVVRLDEAGGRLQTVAAVGPAANGSTVGHRELAAGELQRLAAWCRTGSVAHERAGTSGALSTLLPAGAAGDVLVGPLRDGDQALGAILVLARPPRAFDESHEKLLASLLEPFAVALHNDRRVVEMARLREAAEADNRALLSRLAREDISDSVVGAEAGLRGVMGQVEKVAPTDTPVLILGETGSGKEVIARAIHERSRRRDAPVVRVNCGAIPSELVDSELFGHERGSFTGAIAARKGWFERADGGTLFLDEIGELPLAAQVRLLRILQDGTFERVGAQRPQSCDVRLVAATHRDLREMVAAGTFRQDLWYRISVFPIRLPALRERPGDVPALARHFARRAGVRLGGMPLEPDAADLARLAAYDWPGNVRELAAVIERAAILGGGKSLHIEAALGPAPAARATTNGVPQPELAAPARTGAAGQVTLDQAMISHIEQALVACSGRIEGKQGAAHKLGINPHTLRARMRKFGIDWARFRG